MSLLTRVLSRFRRQPAKEAADLGFGFVPDPGLANNNWFRQWVGIYQLVDRMARARGGNAVERPLDDRMLYIARGLMRYNSYAQGYMSALRTHTLGSRGLQHLATGKSAKVLQGWLDWWMKEVDWWSWEREIYDRVHVEGDSITRFTPDSGCVLLRPIEPEWIIPKDGSLEWTFGFYNEPDDVHDVTALNTLYGSVNEVVDRSEWYHIKSKISVKADKRGRSDFLPVASLLDDSFKTWRNFAQSEAVRQAIIYFSEAAEGVTAEDLAQAVAAQADYSAPTADGKRGGDPVKLTFGAGVEHLPPGTKLNSVPMGAVQSTVAGVNATMLAVGRQYHMPLVLMTGDMGANNTLDFGDESPFGMAIGDEQNWYSRHIRGLLWQMIEIAVDEGYVDEEVLHDGTDIEVTAERKPARDMDKNTARAKTLAEDGIISKRERSTLEGVDYDDQQEQIVRERESQAVVDVVGTALNGAQVSSLLEITDKVAAKQYPAEAAAALISTAFPLLSAQVVEKIVAAIGKFKPPPQPAMEDTQLVTVHRGGKTFQQRRRKAAHYETGRKEVSGHSDGKERAVLVSADGEVLKRAEGDEDAVPFPKVKELETPGAGLHQHHNHPYETPPSMSDVFALGNYPGLESITIHTPTAEHTIERATDDLKGFNDTVKTAFEVEDKKALAKLKADKKLRDAGASEQEYARASERALKELQAKGLIKYTTTQSVMESVEGLVEKEVTVHRDGKTFPSAPFGPDW